MLTLDSFIQDLGTYLESSQVEQVLKAYNFAHDAHTGQTRKSGEPYITHPLAVANIAHVANAATAIEPGR